MNVFDIVNQIETTVLILNNIEVKGQQNMDNLSGSIRVLKKVAGELREMVAQAADSSNTEG